MLFRAPRGKEGKKKEKDFGRQVTSLPNCAPVCASVCVHVGELHLTHEQGFDLKVQRDNRGV